MKISDRKPDWLVRKIPDPGKAETVTGLLADLSLHTVCQEAHCPNQGECYGRGTATFLLLGPGCSRNCTFCAVEKDSLSPPDGLEPTNIATAVERLGLNFCVLTMVTRDDLMDGGAAHVAATIDTVRRTCPTVGLEVLVSDFGGDEDALNTVLRAGPNVLNHNLETIPRLYPSVRPMANYRQSLDLLGAADEFTYRPVTKSGLMLGLGETMDEVLSTLDDLRDVGCDALTLGQYLAPSGHHHPVVRYISPDEFDTLAEEAKVRGFKGVASGPYVRSSYNAEQLFRDSRIAGDTGSQSGVESPAVKPGE